jgi:hypothetical protein
MRLGNLILLACLQSLCRTSFQNMSPLAGHILYYIVVYFYFCFRDNGKGERLYSVERLILLTLRRNISPLSRGLSFGAGKYKTPNQASYKTP